LEEEIFFVLNNIKREKSQIQDVTDNLLSQFGLTKYRKKYPRYLSIGEQQKAALATVLAIEPQILILDEPTHGMDYKQKNLFMEFLNEYRKQGNAVILISHDVETIAKFSERIILLSDGKIVMDDLKRNVLSSGLLFSPQTYRLIQNFEDFSDNILTADEFLEVFEF
jgi:energy-coupling factor transport system ATP-binding protein